MQNGTHALVMSPRRQLSVLATTLPWLPKYLYNQNNINLIKISKNREVLEKQDHKCLLQALCLKKIMRPLNKQHIYFTFQLPQYLCQSAWISAAVPTVLLGPMFAKEADDER